jgi:protein AaeX
MRFVEIDIFGLYFAPIAAILVAAWVGYVVIRRTGDSFGFQQHVWHPALFEAALYVIVASSIVLAIAHWGR